MSVAQSGRYDFKVVAAPSSERRARSTNQHARAVLLGAASNATSLKAHAGMKAMRAWETTTLSTLNVMRLISNPDHTPDHPP